MSENDSNDLEDTPTVIIDDARLAALCRESRPPKGGKRIARADELQRLSHPQAPKGDPPCGAA